MPAMRVRDRVGTDVPALLAALLAVLVLLVAACGGDGGNGSKPSTGAAGTASPGSASLSGTTPPQGGPSMPAATGGGPSMTATPTRVGPPGPGLPGCAPCPVPSDRPGARMQASVYFLHGEKLSAAHRTVMGPAIARGAIEALLAGPSGFESTNVRTTTIPAGTRLLDLDIRNGQATVDLSGQYATGGGTVSMRARLAQVVFTLTGFQGVQSVQLRLDGKPVTAFGGEGIVLGHPLTRAEFEDLSPAVLVETPTIGDTVTGVLRVAGSANTFEAILAVSVCDAAGRVLADQHTTATSGTGTRGTFDVTLRFTAPASGTGVLTAYVESPKDGSRVVVDDIPVAFSG